MLDLQTKCCPRPSASGNILSSGPTYHMLPSSPVNNCIIFHLCNLRASVLFISFRFFTFFSFFFSFSFVSFLFSLFCFRFFAFRFFSFLFVTFLLVFFSFFFSFRFFSFLFVFFRFPVYRYPTSERIEKKTWRAQDANTKNLWMFHLRSLPRLPETRRRRRPCKMIIVYMQK